MGNTPSSEEGGFDKDEFIKEQKKIILEQNEQIQRLAGIAEEGVQTNERTNTNKSNGKYKEKINPYKELGISQMYDESSLKKAYLNKALETHPDRGGSQEAFQRVTVSYKALMIKLKNEVNSHEHNELRDNSSQFREQQVSDNRQSKQYTDISQNFNSNVFNQIYEENRMDDVEDEGYERWMKETENEEKDIVQNSSLTKDNFNTEFAKTKQQYLRKKGSELQKYSEPIEDISYKNKSSLMQLGKGKVENFSGESGGLSFRDYKDAYTNTFLIGDDIVDPKKRPKSLKGIEKQRSNISYEMGEEEHRLHSLKKIKEDQAEELRIKRLLDNDQNAFNIYDKVHQRMLGH